MTFDPVLSGLLAFLATFFGVCAVGLLIGLPAYRLERRSLSRLRALGGDQAPREVAWKSSIGANARSALVRLGSLIARNPKRYLNRLQEQFSHAGIYYEAAPLYFLGVKVIGAACGMLLGLLAVISGFIGWDRAVLCILTGGCAGMMAPNIWLRSRINTRQNLLRHAIPDALDMLVMCTEGGSSFVAGFQRISDQIHRIHPVLASEMKIIECEIQMGLSPGDALKKFGERSGLAEVRDLAFFLLQSERFGGGISKALRTYAEGARIARQQRAEEQAQKASVKILFPMLLLIFPAIFVVLMGPALFQISKLFVR